MDSLINIPLLVPKPLWRCQSCWGRGWEWIRDCIDGEWDKDTCRFCDGRKYVAHKTTGFFDY